MPYTQAQWILIFFTYCFLGWIWETLYVSFLKKEWVNRGFLHGPLLPIYGFGAMIVLWLTLPFRENTAMIYLLGLLGATILEYLTGAVMEKLFHMRYWDYSHHRLNINGHISLFTSLGWGLFSVLLIKLLHPPIERVLAQIPYYLEDALSLILMIVFVVDVTKSVQSALNMKKLLKELTENNEYLSSLELKLNYLAEGISQASDEFQKHIQRIEDDIQDNISIHQYKIESKKQSNKAYLLDKIEKGKNKKSNFLTQLNKKTDVAAEEIQLRISSSPSESEKLKLSKTLEDLRELKTGLRNIEIKIASLRDKEYQVAADIIRRNPTSVSKHFKGALDEIKSLNKSKNKD